MPLNRIPPRVDPRFGQLQTDLTTEVNRATAAEATKALATDLSTEVTRAQAAEVKKATAVEVRALRDASHDPPRNDDPNAEFLPRDRHIGFSAEHPFLSQSLYVHYFTCRRTFTVKALETFIGATPVTGTVSRCQMGLYSADAAGAGSLLVSTINDTSLWNAANVAHRRNTDANFDLVIGQRYGVAILHVSSGPTPSIVGPATGAYTFVEPILLYRPAVSGGIFGVTTLPATIAPTSAVRFIPACQLVGTAALVLPDE